MANEVNDFVEDESAGLGCALESFKEHEDVVNMITNVKNIYKDSVATENTYEKLKYTMGLYQEQPHLLDPFLDEILTSLLNIARDDKADPLLQNQAFKILYLLTKTRGAKVIVRHMPHEIGDLQHILKLLAEQNPRDSSTWETRYMLLIWLSIVVMIPIHLVRLDGGIEDDGGTSTLDRILNFVKLYLTTTDMASAASPILAGRFLTRPDTKITHLPKFIDWALKKIDNTEENDNVKEKEAVLAALAQLFKHGKREDMKEHGANVLQKILQCKCTDDINNVVRKNSFKLIQRIGLTFMKIKIAHWRYCRGSRSLASNLATNLNGLNENIVEKVSSEDDEEYQIPDEIEEIIEQLLKGLRDEAVIARWSSAKGLGRIAERLPKELADDVITTLLDMFHMRDGERAWHGGCLALAELARRGLLLPFHLEQVMPVLNQALVYDELKGNFSTGSNIRDAACYVCWAFARAYDNEILKPYLERLAQGLIINMVFDREVSCRRAAAAAFQESVGRQGAFPFGIEILTVVDYFAVSLISHSYLSLSVFVAQFGKYTISLIDHLVERKVSHWDIKIRELTSQALHNLTENNVNYMVDKVLPILIPLATGSDMNTRHGSILAIAEILDALSKINGEKSLQKLIGNNTLNGIRNIAPTLHEKKMFRGLGGEMFRTAISIFIKKISKSRLLSSSDWEILDLWRDLLYEFLANRDLALRSKAASALNEIFLIYYENEKEKCETALNFCSSNLLSHLEEVRCGFAKVLGGFPVFMFGSNESEIIKKLIECTKITKQEEMWVFSRSTAIEAIIEMIKKIRLEAISDEMISEIYDCLFTSIADYSTDSRGDIGSFVRIAALQELKNLSLMVVSFKPELLNPELVSKLFCSIMRISVEVFDRVRASAADVLLSLLNSSPTIPNIPHYEKLTQVFTNETCEGIVWKNHNETFPLFMQILNEETYTYHLLLGFSLSSGTKTSYLVKFTNSCFHNYLTTIRSDSLKLEVIERTFLNLLRDHMKDYRIIIPLLVMADFLINSGTFDDTDPNKFPFELLNLSWKAGGLSKNAQRVLAVVDILSGLINFQGKCRIKALSSLTICLCHQFPKVRNRSAQKLYEAIVTAGDVVPDENLEELLSILSETEWAANVNKTSFRPIRNKVCELLGIPLPPSVTPKIEN